MIKNRVDCCGDRLQKFYIYLLKDDGTTINDEKYISHPVGDEETFYFAGSRARFVKILMPYRSTAPYSILQLAEVEVYELVHGLPMAYCKALLDEFHVPCEKTTCSSRNDQSYQLTINQVCAAVDSPIKLLTSAVAEHVDGLNRLRGPFVNGAADDYVADIDTSLLKALSTTCCTTPKADGKCSAANWEIGQGSGCQGARTAIAVHSNFVDTTSKSLQEMETEWKEAADQSSTCDGVSTGKKLSFKYLDCHALMNYFLQCYINQTKDTCSTFVKYFDRLYEARNVSEFPHRNPMWNWNDRDAAQMGLESPDYMLHRPLWNGGFEAGGASDANSWSKFEDINSALLNGYTVDTTQTNSGTRSIKVPNGGGGAVQYVTSLEVVEGSQVTIKGYSKAVGTSAGLSPGDYAIYADIKYLDTSESPIFFT